MIAISKHVTIALFALIIFTCRAGAQDPAFPTVIQSTDDGHGHPLLGGQLEGEFQKMVTQCTGDKMLVQKKKLVGGSDTQYISAVPASLRTYIDFGTPVFQQGAPGGESLINAFTYVYTQDEANTNSRGDATSYLNLQYDRDPSQLTQIGVSGVVLNQSCSTVLGASAQVSGGYSIPMASIKAALNSDYDASNSFSLSLVKGKFVSPIIQLFAGTSQEQLFANLLVWKWYYEHPSRAATSNWVLQQFNGIEIYEVAGSKRKMSANISSSGNVSAPFVSADGAISASMDNSSALDVHSFLSYVFLVPVSAAAPSGIDRTFAPLPTPSDLATTIGNLAVITLYGADLTVYDKTTKQHTIDVAGIPSALCDRGRWAIDTVGHPASLSLISATMNTRASGVSPVCSFSISYTPDDAAVASGSALSYQLKSSFDNAGKTYSVGLPVSVNYVSSTRPSLSFVQFTNWAASKNAAGGNTLTWHETLTLDSGGLIKAGDAALDLSQLKLSCLPTGSPSPTWTAERHSTTGNSETVDLQITLMYSGVLPDPTPSNPTPNCSVQGNILYAQNTGGGFISRSFPANAFPFPQQAPAPGTVMGALSDVSKVTEARPVIVGPGQSIATQSMNRLIFNLPVLTQPAKP